MDKQVLKKKLSQLILLRKKVVGTKLEDFNLHWFTKKTRLPKILNALTVLEDLEKMGFKTQRTVVLKKILQEILLAWGFSETKQPKKGLDWLWFKVTKQKKVRKDIVEKYQQQVARYDVRYVNTMLDRLIVQVDTVIKKEHIELNKTDHLEHDPHLGRSRYLTKVGFPRTNIHKQKEYILLHWNHVEEAVNQWEDNKDQKRIYLIRSLASFALNIPEKVFFDKFDDMLSMLSASYSSSKPENIPRSALNVPKITQQKKWQDVTPRRRNN